MHSMYLTDCVWLQPDFEQFMPKIKMSSVMIVGSFLSFFLVFYSSQCFTRFNEQYQLAMSIQGCISDICLKAANCFEQSVEGRAAAHRVMRHCNALHALAFVGLGDLYTEENFLRPFNMLHQIMTAEEYQRILEIDPDQSEHAWKEVISWVFADIQEESLLRPLRTHTHFHMFHVILGLNRAHILTGVGTNRSACLTLRLVSRCALWAHKQPPPHYNNMQGYQVRDCLPCRMSGGCAPPFRAPSTS